MRTFKIIILLFFNNKTITKTILAGETIHIKKTNRCYQVSKYKISNSKKDPFESYEELYFGESILKAINSYLIII